MPESESFSLYGGEVKLEFDPGRHRYVVEEGGRSFTVPSVTQAVGIIDKSGPLLGWATKITNSVWREAIKPNTEYAEVYLEQVYEQARRASGQKKRDAGAIGSEAHQHIDTCFSAAAAGSVPERLDAEAGSCESEAVANCLRAAGGWLQEHQVEPLEIERPIYSRKHVFSGRLDQIALVDGVLSLIDWKSSSGLYPEFLAQTAAYVLAYEEENPDKRIESRWLVRLGKEDGAFEAHEFSRSTLAQDQQAFIAALRIFRWLRDTNALLK